jgi:hypothetical protein
LPPGSEDYLRVAIGTEDMTLLLKIGAQLAEIIYFSVVGDGKPLVIYSASAGRRLRDR